MENYKPSELHSTILRARELFPGEVIAYNLECTQTIDEYIAELKKRIAEAEKAQKN